jgi:trehalose-phosphatase
VTPPSALGAVDLVRARVAGRRAMVFLDYDGTLTPIVARPEDAVLSADMRARVRALADRAPVAVVSGRDLADVEARVGLPGLVYVGSHGFDVAGPPGSGIRLEVGMELVPELDAAERALRARLAAVPGALVERKRFSLAAHYRLVPEPLRDRVREAVAAALAAHPRLRCEPGKAVLDLRPGVDWDKGRAVAWLLDRLAPGAVGVYVGDDVTDESAFAALRGRGIGIAVGVAGRETAAELALRDPGEVGAFLPTLATLLA